MNSLTVCLYVAAGVVIGVLTAFAAQNQRVGWKKSRTALAEALDDFYADLGLSVEPSVEQTDLGHRRLVIAQRDEAPVDPVDFCDQLLRLKGALGDAATVMPREAARGEARERDHQIVPLQTR